MTTAHRSHVVGDDNLSPGQVAVARLAALRAVGVVATARAFDSWLSDGEIPDGGEVPWMVVSLDDLTIEMFLGPSTSLPGTRGVVMRLLADRWKVVVKVQPDRFPEAMTTLGDLPLRIDRWDRV